MTASPRSGVGAASGGAQEAAGAVEPEPVVVLVDGVLLAGAASPPEPDGLEELELAESDEAPSEEEVDEPDPAEDFEPELRVSVL